MLRDLQCPSNTAMPQHCSTALHAVSLAALCPHLNGAMSANVSVFHGVQNVYCVCIVAFFACVCDVYLQPIRNCFTDSPMLQT